MIDSFDQNRITFYEPENKKAQKLPNAVALSLERVAVLSLVLIYLETAFHLWSFKKLDVNYFMKLVMCFPTAALFAFFTNFFKKKVNKIVNWVVVGFFILYYVVNVLYHAIFKVFFSILFVDKNNAKVAQYYKEIIQGIKDNWGILCMIVFVPIAMVMLLNRFRVFRYKKVKLKFAYVPATLFAVSILLETLLALAYGKDSFSPYELMFKENVSEFSYEKLGVFATAEIELKNFIFPNKDLGNDDFSEVWVYTPTEKTETSVVETVGDDGEIIQEIVEKVIDTSPNMLDIDFVSLAENEENEYVAGIHSYMSTLVPTNKNEYTGLFKGFNVIFMTAEGFCNLAVDEKYTPTLYKMVHEGFEFTNFYNPRTGGSTSDGEFICNNSLYPVNGGARNFKIVGQNAMPFSLGNYFNRTYKITSKAYHDNDFQYYGRDISYPSIGYLYQGIGNGLEMPTHWPSSDDDMMQATFEEYANDEIFNVYYMTVSGHLNYNFEGNWCARIHKDDVADMQVSEACKAYIACNMELDLACKYLLEQLEEKGILDRTIICFTGDHWPYGLTNEEFSELLGHPVEENFELYKSNLILYSGAIKEHVVIDKACCSMDILPTLLNLFGFEYDSRLYMGQDIFSDTEGFVGMWNKSIVTDRIMYNSQTGEVTNLTGEELPEDYVDNLKNKLALQRKYSERIMTYDYYQYIADYLGIPVEEMEQNYKPDYSKFTP